MINKKLASKQILSTCIFSILFVSLISCSKSSVEQVESEYLLSNSTLENNQPKSKKRSQPESNSSNSPSQARVEDKPKKENNQNQENQKELEWPDNGAPDKIPRGGGWRREYKPERINTRRNKQQKSNEIKCPSSITELTALVPGDGNKSFIASTATENPTFWFYIPELPKTVRKAELLLQEIDGTAVKEVYRKSLTLSGKSGIISIASPSQAEYSLQERKIYRWNFSIYCGDKEKTSDSISVNGFVRKLELPATIKSKLNTVKSNRRYIAYKNNKLWYNALTYLGQKRRTNPENPKLTKNWVRLLNEVGLEDLAEKQIISHYP